MESKRVPYEFLARWDRDGNLCGAHVQWRVVTKDGVKVVAEGVSPAEPVAIGDAKGFPLQDILDELSVSALKKSESECEAKDKALAKLESALQEITRLTPAAAGK